MQKAAKHVRISAQASGNGGGRNDAESRAVKLTNKLADLVKKMPGSMDKDEVHKLRTTVRRVEVVLQSASGGRGQGKLEAQLKKLRKRAGTVRDLDVHLGMLEDLDTGNRPACDEIHTFLKHKRDTQARKLEKILEAEVDEGLRKRLKRAGNAVHQAPLDSSRAEEQLASARERFASLTAEIPEDGSALHQMRIDCKRLRYEVEALAPEEETRAETPVQAEAQELVEHLKRVQDEIGIWHDWLTLYQVAEKHLRGTHSVALIALLRTRTATHYHNARRTVAEVRSQLQGTNTRKKPPKAAGHTAQRRSQAV